MASLRLDYLRKNFAELRLMKPEQAVEQINSQGFDKPISVGTWLSQRSTLARDWGVKDSPAPKEKGLMEITQALGMLAKHENNTHKAKEYIAANLPDLALEIKMLEDELSSKKEKQKELDSLQDAVKAFEAYASLLQGVKTAA